MQPLAALEFCFLPDDFLSFRGSGLKVTSSVKFLLTVPAPNNRFLELHLQVLLPPPAQGAALKPALGHWPWNESFFFPLGVLELDQYVQH